MRAHQRRKVTALHVAELESLAGQDMGYLCLSAMNFSNLNLRRTNFQGCHLRGSIFDNSDLTEANLQDVDLRNASFKATNLTRTIFANVLAADADFEDADGLSNETRAYLKSRGANGV